MSTSPFHVFIDLVQFDQDIQKTIKKIQKQQEELAQQAEHKANLQHELDQLRQVVHDAQKAVHASELEMKKLDTREADIKKKLDEISNVKEYTGLKKELDAVQAVQLQHEEALVSAWNQLETAQRVMSQKEGAMQEKVSAMDAAIAHTAQETEHLERKLQEDKQARPEKAKMVNAEWLEKYEMMQGRVDNPVVEVVQGGCGGCFYAIPGQDLMRLKNRALLQCNSCYRFLYNPDVLKMDAASETTKTSQG